MKNCKCGKIRYRDKQHALWHLHWMQANAVSQKIPSRSYHCELCKGWHLTSQEYATEGTEIEITPKMARWKELFGTENNRPNAAAFPIP